MSESGRETLPNVREWWEVLPDVREWWEVLPDVHEASRVPRSVRDALPNAQVWSRNPLGCPEVVGRPFRKFGRPYRLSGSVRWPSRMSGNERESLPDELE